MRKIINWIKLQLLKFKYKENLILGHRILLDYNSSILIDNGSINIGNNVVLRSNSKRYHAGMPFSLCLFTDIEDAQITIGDNCRLNGSYVHAQKSIIIKNNCVIASGVQIIDSNGHRTHSTNRTVGRDKPKNILIQRNVWIGLNSVILKGTKIGENSIVSAGSVVKGEFPSNSIIAGNPAEKVGTVNID